MILLGKDGHQSGIRDTAEGAELVISPDVVFTSGRRMNAAVGKVSSTSEERALVLVGPFAFLLGTCRYESKVTERRLAEDEIVFAVCGRPTGKLVSTILDLCLVDGVWRSGLLVGIRHVGGDIGENVVTVFDRGLEGDVVEKVSSIGVDKVGGSGDTALMVCDRGLRRKEGGDPGDEGV
jgi:hypothetical protein